GTAGTVGARQAVAGDRGRVGGELALVQGGGGAVLGGVAGGVADGEGAGGRVGGRGGARSRVLGVDQGGAVGARRGGLDVTGLVVGDRVEAVAAVDRAGEGEALARIRGAVGARQGVADDPGGVRVDRKSVV